MPLPPSWLWRPWKGWLCLPLSAHLSRREKCPGAAVPQTSSPSPEVLTSSFPVSTVHGPGEDGEQLSPWGTPKAWEPAR